MDLEEVLLQLTGENISLSYTFSDSQLSQLEKTGSVDGVQCLLMMWQSNNTDSGNTTCEPVWDNIFCWPETPAGTIVTELCSVAFAASQPAYAAYLQGNATRICLHDGTWSDGIRTNYDECATSFEENERKSLEEKRVVSIVQHILFVGSILSLVSLTVALAIFRQFRCLRCDRVALLVQLMLALVLRFIVLLIITEPFVFGRSSSYRDVDVICKGVILLHLYATVSSVSWMFVQGFYLNSKLTSNVFNDHSRNNFPLYFFIGWAAPAVLLAAYFVVMLIKDSALDTCWKGYADMTEIWILLGPMLLALLLNAAFLLNILRILLEKVRRSTNPNADASQLMAAAKATLVLSPVLGINNLLLLYNPGGDYEKYYVIANTLFGATQGIFVSIVYCFGNKEVQEAIRRCYTRKLAQRRWVNREPAGPSQLPTTRERVENAEAVETFL